MKKTLLLTSLLSVFVLGWCFNGIETKETPLIESTDQITISSQAQDEADKRVIGNETCDNYIATIQCIAKKGGDENDFAKNYDSILASLQDIPSDQLQEVCTSLTSSLQEHPTLLLYNAECDMITPTSEDIVSNSESNETPS